MDFVRQPGNRGGGVGHRLFEARRLANQLLEGTRCGMNLFAQFLDLALGGQDAARFRLVATGDDVLAAEDIALERDHRVLDRLRNARSSLE